MFGVSFLEITVVGLVALIVVGPQKLPQMMRTAGEWVGRLQKMTADMRVQTGIDDILREEGIDGVRELRTLLRGEQAFRRQHPSAAPVSAFSEPSDLALEFPTEGPDAWGALPEDLLSLENERAPESAPSSLPPRPTT